MPQLWLAAQWAILRYFGAADHSIKSLRLQPAAVGLETHAKAVLSDDWGVGISLQWLTARLRYSEVAHGRFAMPDLIRNGIATTKGNKKRGPKKCPDFFALDRQNKVHIIECKGNQQGPDQTTAQFEKGQAQKRNVKFKNEKLVGQRLLSGVAIAGIEDSWQTTLQIADPPPNNDDSLKEEWLTDSYTINALDADSIRSSLNKVSLIQGLLLAGAFTTAHRAFPSETKSESLAVIPDRLTEFLGANGARWYGQMQEVIYPALIHLPDESTVSGCRLRFGVSEELLEELNKNSFDDLLASRFLAIEHNRDVSDEGDSAAVDQRKLDGDIRRYASIQRGVALIADIELL